MRSSNVSHWIPSKSLAVLWAILLAAIIALTFLAQSWIRQRAESSRERVRSIFLSQMSPIDDAIIQVVDRYSTQLRGKLSRFDLADQQQCVEITRSPLVHALVVVNAETQLHFPEDIGRETVDRRSLIEEAQQLLREQGDPRPRNRSQASRISPDQTNLGLDISSKMSPSANLRATTIGEDADRELESSLIKMSDQQSGSLRSRSYRGADNIAEDVARGNSQLANQPEDNANQTLTEATEEGGFGWITWYHRRGMVLGFWWQQSADWRSIAVLPSARWTADTQRAAILQRAKVTLGNDEAAGALYQLVDVEGNVIYQWGDAPNEIWETLALQELTAEMPVANPLEGWRLRVYASDSLVRQLAGDEMATPIWIAVASVALALLMGGLFVTINLNRQLRLAASRVSFVNQVSHELRTPLTNICMYADLLATDIEVQASDPRQLERVNVIQNESRRLNRLIGNVLEFARVGSHTKPLRRRSCVLDDLIQEVLATFKPRLEEIGFRVRDDLKTPLPRLLDPDAVEQILVNLVGNAEKYATSGKLLEVTTTGNSTHVEIVVRDEGPGVPRLMSERVFAPFERLSDRLEDPAGTGIGLTIVRELARRHGGDCRLVDSSCGAMFCCTLEAPIVDEVL